MKRVRKQPWDLALRQTPIDDPNNDIMNFPGKLMPVCRILESKFARVLFFEGF